MPEVPEKLKSNIKERVGAITLIGDNLADTAKVFVEGLKKMEPVQAVCDAGMKFGDGTFRFIKKQAEITRKWVKEI